jgi:PTH1 family peptidyl-tRNA hydrolase
MGRRDDLRIEIIKPTTYMNRSGSALAPLSRERGFDIGSDLLVVVDEVALDPGRARFRASGSAGGHNGLKSVEASLGTREYARLRIGVGEKPSRMDLADWVLAAPPKPDRDAILGVIPELVDCIGIWTVDGIDAAMNRCNGA